MYVWQPLDDVFFLANLGSIVSLGSCLIGAYPIPFLFDIVICPHLELLKILFESKFFSIPNVKPDEVKRLKTDQASIGTPLQYLLQDDAELIETDIGFVQLGSMIPYQVGVAIHVVFDYNGRVSFKYFKSRIRLNKCWA